MWTGTRIAVTGIMSGAYVSTFILIYLFIHTYISALVDIMQDYKKCHEKMRCAGTGIPAGCQEFCITSGNKFQSGPASTYQNAAHYCEP